MAKPNPIPDDTIIDELFTEHQSGVDDSHESAKSTIQDTQNPVESITMDFAEEATSARSILSPLTGIKTANSFNQADLDDELNDYHNHQFDEEDSDSSEDNASDKIKFSDSKKGDVDNAELSNAEVKLESFDNADYQKPASPPCSQSTTEPSRTSIKSNDSHIKDWKPEPLDRLGGSSRFSQEFLEIGEALGQNPITEDSKKDVEEVCGMDIVEASDESIEICPHTPSRVKHRSPIRGTSSQSQLETSSSTSAESFRALQVSSQNADRTETQPLSEERLTVLVTPQPKEYITSVATHESNKSIDDDSSTLFIPERSVPPQQVRIPSPLLRIPLPKRVQPLPRAVSTSGSFKHPTALAKIQALQKMQKQTQKAPGPTPTPPIVSGDVHKEEYLQTMLASITPSSSASTAAILSVDSYELEHRRALAEFEKQRCHYDRIKAQNDGKLNFRQSVEWTRIWRYEEARIRKREQDLACAKRENLEDVNTGQDGANESGQDRDDKDSDDKNAPRPSSKRKRGPDIKLKSIRHAELQSLRVALEAEDDLPEKKRKNGFGLIAAGGRGLNGKGKEKGPASRKRTSGGSGNTQAGRNTVKERRLFDQASRQAISLVTSDIFHQQAAANAPKQPEFSTTNNKMKALKEIIASVPLESQKEAQTDMRALLQATRDFNGKGAVKPSGGNCFKVKGMKTTLKNYQVLGTAFMRRRENDGFEPKGGLFADQMGLGKTVMMIANIVNGRPPKGQTPRTTLVVANPQLCTQWAKEIDVHSDCGLKVMRYGSGTRIDSNHAAHILEDHDIILASYHEVMNSYPKMDPPIDCETVEQKLAWWHATFESQRGVLHRIQFLRVVLDEAQAIKNHTGRTSIACRALMANHKWALSGTPIVNSLTELYAYFHFIGVPHTGSFKVFKSNYCNSRDSAITERLLLRLSQFMLRRTHEDQMFEAPILKLPKADQGTYWCEFNSVERCIYEIVQERFLARVNKLARDGELSGSYSNILVMLLRLRQLTAHVLMLQFVMKDLLEREDIEKIQKIAESTSIDTASRAGKTIIAVRKQLDQLAANAKEESVSYDDEDDPQEDEEEVEFERLRDEPEEAFQTPRGRITSGGAFGKGYNFKPFLNSLRTGESWKKAKERSRCMVCDKQPKGAWASSCGHLVCGEPCLEALYTASGEENQESSCRSCGQSSVYFHPLDPEEEQLLRPVASGTRSKTKQKQDRERKRRENEDIKEDWLASLEDDVLPSAKTIAVKAQIMNWIKQDKNVKVIVYTQFLAMARILSRICTNEGWGNEMYTGKMSFTARDTAIKRFDNDPSMRVLLASLRCGGLGLNLTMASRVIILDPWWNQAAEQQAFCRVFRIGQKRKTFMSRLCVKNSIDHRLIDIQQRKQEEIDKVMADDGSGISKLEERDIIRLFSNLDDDSSSRPFIVAANHSQPGGFRVDDDEVYANED